MGEGSSGIEVLANSVSILILVVAYICIHSFRICLKQKYRNKKIKYISESTNSSA